MRGKRGSWLGIAAITALVALLAPSASFGQGLQTVTPTRFDDPGPGPAGCQPNVNCSLRQALAAVSQGGTVNLLAGTYELSAQPSAPATLVVRPGITINGAGARSTTIDANGLARVLFVQESNEIATINDVTITGGTTTGQDTQGGGIYVEHNAGLALNRSAVVGNRAATQGGGIYSGSGNTVTITDSTISGNEVLATMGGQGGGVYGTGGGAGIQVSNVRIFNSTISGNSTPGIRSTAGISTSGALEMVHVTMAGNAGEATLSVGSIAGVPVPALSISNTIITSDSGSACSITSFRTNAGTNNLADDATCTFGTVANPLLGALQDNGGQTNTHALAVGSPAIDTAAAAQCRPTDQRGTTRPQLGACDIGAFEYVPPPPGGQAPPEDEQLPPPQAGRTVNALPKSGTVRVKLPGRKKFRRLSEGEQLPVGTTFDTRKGHVTLVTAADKKGKTSTAEFWAGIFKLAQTKKAKPLTTLKLIEKLRCPTAGKATIAAKRKKKRRLWGDGKGRFRTEGEFSSATVRGTKWLVEDRCTSTLTRVVRGSVTVRDGKKRVIVRKNKRYIARPG